MMHLKKTFILASILLSMLLMWSACESDSAAQQEATTTTDSQEKITSPPLEVAAANISDTEKTSESNSAKSEKDVSTDKKEVEKTLKKKEKKEVKEKKKKKKRAKMHFPKKVYDYGFIMQGDTVTHDFHFKNVGSADLVITKVVPSCGCTVPIFPKEPIAPGKEGKISVMFKSAGKLGRQVPNISVYTNYKRKIKLELKGYVDAERAKKKPVIVGEKTDSQ